jgi:hypothetical protein
MLINVKALKPNPYRRIDKYPIDKHKIEALKNSIKETSFWDNLLCRKVNDTFQIAYGHHRLQALKELGIKEVDIPVKNLDDSTMIKIMANENMAEWSSNTGVILETIQVAKEYLESEIAKYDNFDEILPKDFFRQIIENAHCFTTCKRDGIGLNTLKKFLGANWTDYYIQSALQILKNDNIDSEAVKQFNKIGDAQVVSQVLKDHDIPKEKQEKIIKSAVDKLESETYQNIKTGRVEKGIPRKETKLKAVIEDAIEEEGYKTDKENFNKIFPKYEENPDINKPANAIIKSLSEINTVLPDVLKSWQYLDKDVQERLVKFITRMYTIINENKGDKQWKLLQ